MALFAISDLHLSLSADKPMDVFSGWDNYVKKIKNNWCEKVKSDDTVVIPGDISWAMKLKDTHADFEFINNLPGKKIILKGNHDLWWESLTKMNSYLKENGFDTINFLHNNCVVAENYAVCGSRGWFFEDESAEKKILLREAGRVETSIKHALQTGKTPLLFLHYPPVIKGACCNEIMDIIKKYSIKNVFYGHIHKGGCFKAVTGDYNGVLFANVSCDMLGFDPLKISC